jgi:hypothetical protein
LGGLGDKKYGLSHNRKDDVVVYLVEWAKMLENQMIENIKLPTFEEEFNQVYA